MCTYTFVRMCVLLQKDLLVTPQGQIPDCLLNRMCLCRICNSIVIRMLLASRLHESAYALHHSLSQPSTALRPGKKLSTRNKKQFKNNETVY